MKPAFRCIHNYVFKNLTTEAYSMAEIHKSNNLKYKIYSVEYIN